MVISYDVIHSMKNRFSPYWDGHKKLSVMQQIIDIVQRLMEELDVTVLGLLCGAFSFILGVIISQYKLEECFHHRRVWSGLAVSLGLLILAVCMDS